MGKMVIKNGEKIFIREMEVDDAEKFLKYVKIVGDETNNLTFSSDEMNFTIEEEKKLIENFRKNENELILKAETESGEIVAGLTFSASPRKRMRHAGEFGISVLKKYWGFGIAKGMLNFLEEWARNTNIISKINLSVKEDNLRAIELYEKLGYRKEGLKSRAYKIDEKYYDEILMGKEL
ncbi:MAG: GNAT family N-acetyltransferase [Rhodothermaceae bacterium]